MSWKIAKRFTFEAAHRLPHHGGKCARLHGHSWVGWIVLCGNDLKSDGVQTGMVVDYADVIERIRPLVDQHLDHQYLNESTGLENPTSEELARWIYNQTKPLFGDLLKSVIIEETCTSRAEYEPQSDPH